MGFDLPPIATDLSTADVFVSLNSPDIGVCEFNGAPVSGGDLLPLGAIACTSALSELVEGSRLKQFSLSYTLNFTGFSVNPVPPDGLEVAIGTEFNFDQLFLSGSFRSQAIIAFGTSCPAVLGGG